MLSTIAGVWAFVRTATGAQRHPGLLDEAGDERGPQAKGYAELLKFLDGGVVFVFDRQHDTIVTVSELFEGIGMAEPAWVHWHWVFLEERVGDVFLNCQLEVSVGRDAGLVFAGFYIQLVSRNVRD